MLNSVVNNRYIDVSNKVIMFNKISLFCMALACSLALMINYAISDEKSTASQTNGILTDVILDVIIVGGGIAGMTAAYQLKDYNILVLEKRSTVGGKTFSGKYKDFTYAKGTEYLGKLEGPLKRIVKELNLTVREIPYPADIHFHNGKYFYGDMGKALMLAKKSSIAEFNSFVSAIQWVYRSYEDIPDLDMESKIARLDKISARQWFEEKKFPEIYADTYNVTFKGLFGATIDEISALSALTEIAFDYEGEEKIESFSELRNDSKPGKYNTGMYSFDNGIAEIPLAIAERLGSKVQVNSKVVSVKEKDDVYFVTYENQYGKENTYQAHAVILAVPAPVTLNIANKVLSNEQIEIIEKVSYAPYLTVALFSEEPIFNKGFDLAVPDGMFFTDVYDGTWTERYYNKHLKDKKAFVTTIYIAPESYKDRSILSMPEEKILSTLYKDMGKIFPGVKDKVKDYEIIRFNFAYPVMTPGAYKRLTRLHEITKDGLLLAGDYMIYPTFEAAAVSGVLAAEKAMDWLEE